MARCRFGILAAFQWKCAAAPAQQQFGIGAVLFAVMLFYMHKQWASKRKNKSAEGLPKNSWSYSVLFGRLPLAFLSSVGLSTDGAAIGGSPQSPVSGTCHGHETHEPMKGEAL